METYFELGTLSNVDIKMVSLVENHLKEVQRQTFSASRGPNGFCRIKGLAIVAETKRKEKRREDFIMQKDDQSSISTVNSNEDLVEYFTEIPNAARKNNGRSLIIPSLKDDTIFDMEMEEIKSPKTPTKSLKTWRKISFSESIASSSKTSPSLNSPTPWLSSSTGEK